MRLPLSSATIARQLCPSANLPKISRTMKASGRLIAYDSDNHDPEAFDLMPEWLQKKIGQRKTEPSRATSVAAPSRGAPSDGEFNDNIPF